MVFLIGVLCCYTIIWHFSPSPQTKETQYEISTNVFRPTPIIIMGLMLPTEIREPALCPSYIKCFRLWKCCRHQTYQISHWTWTIQSRVAEVAWSRKGLFVWKCYIHDICRKNSKYAPYKTFVAIFAFSERLQTFASLIQSVDYSWKSYCAK